MSCYATLAENLQYIVPQFYKVRYFKKQNGINKQNILARKIEPELLWIYEYLSKDSVFFDVGVNVGAYVFRLENRLKKENIYAFEPNKKLYHRLKRIFPKIKLFPVALSDKTDTALFKIPVIKGERIYSRGSLELQHKEIEEEKSEFFEVERVRLDDWVATENIMKIDFIKIDVEGHEMACLHGAEQTIKCYKPTLMVEMEQRHHEQKLWELITEIQNWGYQSNYLCRELFTLKPLTQSIIEAQKKTQLKNYQNYINNIIFIPNP